MVIEQKSFDELVLNQVKEGLEKGQKELTEKIRSEQEEKVSLKFDELTSEITDQKKTLGERKDKILELQSDKRKSDIDKDNREIKYNERFSKETEKIREEVSVEFDGKFKFVIAEKDKKLSDLSEKLDEAKRKINQGSQQLQGEVLEIETEQLLRSHFPHDNIVPIAKGVRGADVLQKVITPAGEKCGAIVWETKRTKTWSDAWIQKLKDDQLVHKADIAILRTLTLPKDVKNFAKIDDVWVIGLDLMLPIAATLRSGIIEHSKTKAMAVGKSERMEMLFNYLTGKEFSQRFSVIVNAFIDMKAQLDKEKKAITAIWSKREKQIERVQLNMSSIYGGLQEIAGASLPELESMELAALPDPSNGNKSASESDSDLPF